MELSEACLHLGSWGKVLAVAVLFSTSQLLALLLVLHDFLRWGFSLEPLLLHEHCPLGLNNAWPVYEISVVADPWRWLLHQVLGVVH